MKYENDKISVIIPCYNGEKYIDTCLNALLNQTYKNIQVIVVDDGSIDNSLKKLNDYVSRFRRKNMQLIVKHQNNNGQAAAINNALLDVTGEFLCWQDIDDFYCKDALENMINLLKTKKANFMRGEAAFYNINNINEIIRIGKSNNPENTDIFESYIYQTDSYAFPGIFMVKMECFDKYIKKRKIYESREGQNWQLILPIAYNEKCFYLNKVVYNMVEHSDSHSRRKYNSAEELINRIEGLEDVLINTLRSIGVYDRYKKTLNNKYLREKMEVSYTFSNKELYNKYYMKLKENNEINNKDKIKKILVNNVKLKKMIDRIRGKGND